MDPVVAACIAGDYSTLYGFDQTRPDLSAILHNGYNMVHLAANHNLHCVSCQPACGWCGIVRYLVTKYRQMVHSIGCNGSTPLHMACTPQVANILLLNGASTYTLDNFGNTPALAALRYVPPRNGVADLINSARVTVKYTADNSKDLLPENVASGEASGCGDTQQSYSRPPRRERKPLTVRCATSLEQAHLPINRFVDMNSVNSFIGTNGRVPSIDVMTVPSPVINNWPYFDSGPNPTNMEFERQPPFKNINHTSPMTNNDGHTKDDNRLSQLEQMTSKTVEVLEKLNSNITTANNRLDYLVGQSDARQMICEICIDEKRNCALECGHVLCRTCADRKPKCPFCQFLNPKKMKIFL